MHDDLKEEAIIDMVGGRFKLSALIQKRMAELMRNAKPQVDYRGVDRLGLIIEEIKQGKIILDTSTASKQSVLGAQEAAVAEQRRKRHAAEAGAEGHFLDHVPCLEPGSGATLVHIPCPDISRIRERGSFQQDAFHQTKKERSVFHVGLQ